MADLSTPQPPAVEPSPAASPSPEHWALRSGPWWTPMPSARPPSNATADRESQTGRLDDLAGLRVLHLGKFYPPAAGGIETHTRILARAQADQGLDVSVLCAQHQGSRSSTDADGPVTIHRQARLGSLAKFEILPGLSLALSRAARQADLLHVHVPNPSMLLALLARGGLDRRARGPGGPPLVVTYHSDVIRQKVLGALFRPFELRVYRKVKAILATSPAYAAGSSFLRGFGDRVAIVPLGIELNPYVNPSSEQREQARRLRSSWPEGPVWLGCGRMVGYKGFPVAIRAMATAPGVLVLVGDGPARPELEALVRQLNLRDRVRFAGHLPHYLDIIPYYLAADAFWCSSIGRAEAFGMTQVEAMACGLPIINTAIAGSGVSWVAPHGLTGLTVPVDNPPALAEAAWKMAEQPDQRAAWGQAARRRAQAEFDHRVMADRVAEVYRKVLGATLETRAR